MNTKIDKDPNQEILIAETASEELSNEILDNVTGGTKITYANPSSIFLKYHPDAVMVAPEFCKIDFV